MIMINPLNRAWRRLLRCLFLQSFCTPAYSINIVLKLLRNQIFGSLQNYILLFCSILDQMFEGQIGGQICLLLHYYS